MPKGAWILPAIMLVALLVAAIVPAAASAADSDMIGKSSQTFFKNLPGVAPQESLTQSSSDEYKCTSDIGYVSGFRRTGNFRYWDDVPTRLYHCQAKNGVSYTGTQMPNTQWVPGLNPYDLPR